MNRWFLGIAVIASLGQAVTLHGQQPSVDKLADSIRIAIETSVDGGDREGVSHAVILAERALAAHPSSAILQHYYGYGLYRAATLALAARDKGAARTLLDRAARILEALDAQATIPETPALLASVYGLKISVARVSMVAGMTLGPKSSALLDKALAAGPRNPRVWLMKGIGAFNTPAAFGGGLADAETALKSALGHFAGDDPSPPLPAWGQADAHIWLGQVYAKQKKPDLARAHYDSALVLQPLNAWITGVLKPALDR